MIDNKGKSIATQPSNLALTGDFGGAAGNGFFGNIGGWLKKNFGNASGFPQTLGEVPGWQLKITGETPLTPLEETWSIRSASKAPTNNAVDSSGAIAHAADISVPITESLPPPPGTPGSDSYVDVAEHVDVAEIASFEAQQRMLRELQTAQQNDGLNNVLLGRDTKAAIETPHIDDGTLSYDETFTFSIDVKEMQMRLYVADPQYAAILDQNGGVDGKFGPRTQQALEQFQQDHAAELQEMGGFTSGVAGLKTLSFLEKEVPNIDINTWGMQAGKTVAHNHDGHEHDGHAHSLSGTLADKITGGGGRKTSGFGPRLAGNHYGTDISGENGPIAGAEFYPIHGGEVTYTGRMGTLGNVVQIRHSDGYTSLYAHAENVLVKKGQTVGDNDPIATVGNTGASRGAHVHVEVRDQYEQRLNPENYWGKLQEIQRLNAERTPPAVEEPTTAPTPT